VIPDLEDLENRMNAQPLMPEPSEYFEGGPPLSRLVKCRVEFREGMSIPGLGGGVRRHADGLYDPVEMVAYVELGGMLDKVVLVSVRCGLITVNRTKPRTLPKAPQE
jgi:hypothetical protein